ncbi:hypothetical protein KP509_03G074100 [Ceratopteris richardii]|uniref:Uncharacterized protein n=1 Tax=Ceratopteris richardii TaxID=49495 RepID=A0A8T2V107_CERRI|nr:hypothetical protein KP509_03G074100 [Ceratopteris richardii]
MDAALLMYLALTVCLAITILFLMTNKAAFIPSLNGKHVFITGASSGIGLAVARKCLLEGAFVTLVSRSSKNLEEAMSKLINETQCSQDRIQYQVADVGEYSAIADAVRSALLWKPIDVLVCNAGLTRGGFLGKSSIKDIDTVIRTNLNGCIYPLHEALPSLIEHSSRHPVSIVFISSLISFFFMYGHSAYTASKFAVRGLAESMRFELLPYRNIRVTMVCPGFVNTPFLNDLEDQGEVAEVLRKVNLLNEKHAESPGHAASCVLDSLKRGKFLVSTQQIGSFVVAMGRGYTPADSFGRNLFEIAMLVPFRIFSFVFQHNIRHHIISASQNYRKR